MPDSWAPPPGLAAELADWIGSPEFSCLGARAAIRRSVLSCGYFPELGTEAAVAPLHRALEQFIAHELSPTEDFASFAAVFRGPAELTETEFERLLWEQLSRLHRWDARRYGWTLAMSSDPRSARFGYSVAGHPFFIVGLHSQSSRVSRRFRLPTLVFNCHEQFRRLRANGVYAGLARRIRERELLLQRSVNPSLAGIGEDSEAKQYSGRYVGEDWVCPFRATGGPGPR